MNINEETIEEAATEAFNQHHIGQHDLAQDVYEDGFIDGTTWQAKRTYSEEEVVNLLKWCGRNTYHNSQNLKPHWDNQRCGNEKDILNKWFEQFKKK